MKIEDIFYVNRAEIPYKYLKLIGRSLEEKAIPIRRGAHLKRKFNTNIEVVEALYHSKDRLEAAKKLGYCETRGKGVKGFEKKLRECCAYLFEEKVGFNNYFNFMNNYCGYHWCDECNELLPVEEFPVVSRTMKQRTPIEYRHLCEYHYNLYAREHNAIYRKTPNGRAVKNAHSAKRRLRVTEQMPGWASQEKITEIYNRTPDGHVVDHIIPLMGKLVSGLHTEFNLQHLTKEENLSKTNKFDPMTYEHILTKELLRAV